MICEVLSLMKGFLVMSDTKFNPAKTAAELRRLGFNAQTVKVNPQSRTTNPDVSVLLSSGQVREGATITSARDNLVGRSYEELSMAAAGDNSKPIISQTPAKYNNVEGILIKYDDGSIDFVSQRKNKKDEVTSKVVIKFANENAFKKEAPSSKTVYKKFDGQLQIAQETTYTHHRNGKIATSQTKNSKGVVLNSGEYDKNGKITKKVINNKNGELQFTYTYKYEKDGTRLSEKYDKDNNLVQTGRTTYNGDKPLSTVASYPNGNDMFNIEYDENGKIKFQKEFFEDGKVKSQTTYYSNGVIQKQTVYNQDGTVKSTITDEIDGHVDSSKQVGQGDCYLMASIDALKITPQGQNMLDNLIKIDTVDGKKVYTVTFPGAQKAAEALKNDERITNGVSITGKYTFTEDEMQELLQNAGVDYSIGDGDTILLEAAFEKYREEVNQTLKDNNLNMEADSAGLRSGKDENNILAGGATYDAIYVLTGQSSYVYKSLTNQALDVKELREGKIVIVPKEDTGKNPDGTIKAASTVSGKTSDKDELNKMLDKIMNDSNDGKVDYMGTAGFSVKKEDGTISGHSFAIKSVTPTEVILINPWFPDEEVSMLRKDFLNVTTNVSLTSLSAQNPNRDAQPTTGSPSNPTAEPSANPTGVDTNPSAPVNTPTSAPPSGGSSPSQIPQQEGTYKIPKGITYTNMIINMLKEQNIPQTKENIRKAKAQFEALNPGAVKTNRRFKNKHGQLIPYVLAEATVKTPKFEGLK